MSFLRPIQLNPSQADPIWPDSTFKVTDRLDWLKDTLVTPISCIAISAPLLFPSLPLPFFLHLCCDTQRS